MPRIQPIIPRFSWGEISPIMQGQTALTQVQQSCQELVNFVVDSHGGIRRRNGTRYIAPTKYRSKVSRLIPFIFSRENSYILEFGDLYIRFYRDGGQVVDPGPLELYLGDGVSDTYWFRDAPADNNNIRVYIDPDPENPQPIPDTEYSVSAANDPQANLVPGFDSWTNPYTGFTAWTINSPTSATSPPGRAAGDTCGMSAQFKIGIGSTLDLSNEITSVVWDQITVPNTTPDRDVPANSTTELINWQATSDQPAPVLVDVSLDGIENIGGQSHSMVVELRHNDAVVQSWNLSPYGEWSDIWQWKNSNGTPGEGEINHRNDATQLRVHKQDKDDGENHETKLLALQSGDQIDKTGSGFTGPWTIQATVDSGTYITYTITPTTRGTENEGPVLYSRPLQQAAGTDISVSGVKANDTITLVVVTTLNGSPRVENVSMDVKNIQVNGDAKIHGMLVDGNGVTQIQESFTPEVGTRTTRLDRVTWPEPWNYLIACDYGVSVTVENAKVVNPANGKYIIFNTAPAANAAIIFQDVTQPPGDEPITQQIGNPFEIQTPWKDEEVNDLHFVQANDIMYICHDNHHPRKLVRYNAYDWRVEQPNFAPTTTDHENPPWALDGYDPLLGYPRTVAFYQQRLSFGGTISQPQTIWGSRVADFENFSRPESNPVPDDPVSLTIAAQTQEDIQWLASARVLFVGTSGNEHRVTPNSFLAVDNLPDVTRQSEYGSRHIQPLFIGTSAIFIQGRGREVRTYDINKNVNIEYYDSINMAWLSEHITRSGVIAMAYWKIPHSVLWCIRADGVLLSMTYDPSVVNIMEDVLPVGWARQTTDGLFESVAVIPESDADDSYFIVNRTINGVVQRYVEYMDFTNQLNMDSNISYVGAPTTSLAGLNHLEGKTVQVKVDGAVHPDRVVTNGIINLEPDMVDTDREIMLADIGLGYRSRAKTAKWESGNQAGTGQTAMISWPHIFLRLDESAYPMVNGNRAPTRDPQQFMDVPQEIVTGDMEVHNLGVDREGALIIEQDLPLPLHLLAIFGQMTVDAG